MAKLTTNLMSSEDSINVFCEDIGAYLKISSGGISGTRFIVEVITEDDGEEVEEFVSGEYPLHPESVEVTASYELTISAHRTITLDFDCKEDYDNYKSDPHEYIREHGGMELYSTSDALMDADYYEIDDANIVDVEEV